MLLMPLGVSAVYDNCEIYGTCKSVSSITYINQSSGTGGGNTTVYAGNNITVTENSTGFIVGLEGTSVFSWLSNIFLAELQTNGQ